jgi:hypothetical protein
MFCGDSELYMSRWCVFSDGPIDNVRQITPIDHVSEAKRRTASFFVLRHFAIHALLLRGRKVSFTVIFSPNTESYSINTGSTVP